MTAILKNIFENSIGVSVIILILYILRGFLGKRYTSRWQYWVWVILALRLIMPFDFPVLNFNAPLEIKMANPVVYQKPETDRPNNDGESISGTIDTEQDIADNNGTVIVQNEAAIYDRNIFEYTAGLLKRSALALSDILCFVWICGGVILLCIRLGSYFIARSALLKTLVPFDVDLGEIRQQLKINGDIEIFTSYMVTTPVLTGVLNPRIIIPEDSSDDIHLKLALYHELVHYKRCDIGVKLLLFTVTCAYWYNPCVWLMNRLAMEDIELSCDETICHKMNADGKGLYGESILMFAARKKESLLYSTSFSNDKTTVANRIKNIFSENTRRTGIAAIAAVILLAIISGSIFAFSSAGHNAPVDSNDVLEIGPEDQNALIIIELYEKYSLGRDYDAHSSNLSEAEQMDITYENIRPLLWGILESGDFDNYKDYYDDDSEEYQYEVPQYEYLAATEILFHGSLFNGNRDIIGGTAIIYNPSEYSVATKYGNGFEINLVKTGKRMLENGDVIYSFERRNNNSIVGYVDYTVTPVDVPVMPQLLSQSFTDGSTLYAITKVTGSDEPLSSEEITVEISTAEELVQMSLDYAENGHKYANYTYVLINDIDMSRIENFVPIGLNQKISYDERDLSASGFSSTFDGRGYTVSNINITDTYKPYGNFNIGFFAEISKYGVVKNLNIENINITAHNCSGGFAGTVSGVVENCHVSGTINTSVTAGGFAGQIYGYNSTRISDCSADVDIYGQSMIAGFVAYSTFSGYENINANYTIENCISYGSVTSDNIDTTIYNHHNNPNTIGGFVGRATLGNFVNCHVQTPIYLNHTANMVGAFAAIQENGSYTGCTYNPNTSGNWYLIGTFEGKNSYGDYRGFEFTEAVK